jgi:hypothetical protein
LWQRVDTEDRSTMDLDGIKEVLQLYALLRTDFAAHDFLQ